MIELRGGSVEFDGPFFRRDVTQTIRQNAERAVDELSQQGAELVRQNLRSGIRRPTGFTAGAIEGGSMTRTRIVTGARVGSIFGKVRMKPGMSRGGSAAAPADRVPYIIERVLESGHYGGQRGSIIGPTGKRRKTNWYAGRTQKKRRAIHQFRDAYRVLKVRAAAIRADLTRGL